MPRCLLAPWFCDTTPTPRCCGSNRRRGQCTGRMRGGGGVALPPTGTAHPPPPPVPIQVAADPESATFSWWTGPCADQGGERPECATIDNCGVATRPRGLAATCLQYQRGERARWASVRGVGVGVSAAVPRSVQIQRWTIYLPTVPYGDATPAARTAGCLTMKCQRRRHGPRKGGRGVSAAGSVQQPFWRCSSRLLEKWPRRDTRPKKREQMLAAPPDAWLLFSSACEDGDPRTGGHRSEGGRERERERGVWADATPYRNAQATSPLLGISDIQATTPTSSANGKVRLQIPRMVKSSPCKAGTSVTSAVEHCEKCEGAAVLDTHALEYVGFRPKKTH